MIDAAAGDLVADQVQHVTRGTGTDVDPTAERVAELLRDLSRRLVTAALDAAALTDVADALEALGSRLAGAGPSRHGGVHTDGDATQPNPRGTDPLFGAAHPAAPPVRLSADDGHAVGDVVFDARYEGAPGNVHGGYIAAVFDIVCGVAAVAGGRGGGPTGTLTVRYVAPTPVGEPVRFRAWLERIEGRKATVRSTLDRVDIDGAIGTRCAEAQVIVIVRATDV